MVQIAVKELGDGFSVSDYELNVEGVSFTYNTINHWRELYPEATLFFVAGSDIFRTIGTWGRWEELFTFTNFIVVNRDGVNFDEMLSAIPPALLSRVESDYNSAEFSTKAGSILLYNMPPVPVSSTGVRVDIARENLPTRVYEYIVANGLYR
jgi:nicotinate-nucleotide adenylyltransferase